MDKKTIEAVKLFRKNLAEDLRKELEEHSKRAGQALADNRDKEILGDFTEGIRLYEHIDPYPIYTMWCKKNMVGDIN